MESRASGRIVKASLSEGVAAKPPGGVMKCIFKKESKYHSSKVQVGGLVFDSKREAARWQELKLLEKAGEIRELKRQVRFRLIPSQYLPSGRRERPVDYIADFTYRHRVRSEEMDEWAVVVEDTKGLKTKDYIIKRKLMYQRFGVEIREV